MTGAFFSLIQACVPPLVSHAALMHLFVRLLYAPISYPSARRITMFSSLIFGALRSCAVSVWFVSSSSWAPAWDTFLRWFGKVVSFAFSSTVFHACFVLYRFIPIFYRFFSRTFRVSIACYFHLHVCLFPRYRSDLWISVSRLVFRPSHCAPV